MTWLRLAMRLACRFDSPALVNQSVNLVNIVNFNLYFLMVSTYMQRYGWPSVTPVTPLQNLGVTDKHE